MSAQSIAYMFQEAEGWTDGTLLDLALEYIDNQGDDTAWGDFLSERRYVEEYDADGNG